jgi:hypothetical protein
MIIALAIMSAINKVIHWKGFATTAHYNKVNVYRFKKLMLKREETDSSLILCVLTVNVLEFQNSEGFVANKPLTCTPPITHPTSTPYWKANGKERSLCKECWGSHIIYVCMCVCAYIHILFRLRQEDCKFKASLG